MGNSFRQPVLLPPELKLSLSTRQFELPPNWVFERCKRKVRWHQKKSNMREMCRLELDKTQ